MKILAINSSHRGAKGFTQVLLENLREGASAAGAEFETVVLAEQKINRCLGCEVCHTKKSYLKCVYEDQDDVKDIFQKMAEADIIVYATPIYIFAMSGLMKCLLDRLNSTGDTHQLKVSKKGLIFHHINAEICSKPFVLLATYGNLEREAVRNAVSYFHTFSKFMDARRVGLLIRNSAYALQHMGQEDDKKKKVLDAFRQAGQELAQCGKVGGATQRAAARSVLSIPFPIRLLMKVKPLKPAIAREGVKRNAIRL